MRTVAATSLRLRTEEALQNRYERLFFPIADGDLARSTRILLAQPADGHFLAKRIDTVEDCHPARRDGRDHIRKIEIFQRGRNDLIDDPLMEPFLDDRVIGQQHPIDRQGLDTAVEERGEERWNGSGGASHSRTACGCGITTYPRANSGDTVSTHVCARYKNASAMNRLARLVERGAEHIS